MTEKNQSSDSEPRYCDEMPMVPQTVLTSFYSYFTSTEYNSDCHFLYRKGCHQIFFLFLKVSGNSQRLTRLSQRHLKNQKHITIKYRLRKSYDEMENIIFECPHILVLRCVQSLLHHRKNSLSSLSHTHSHTHTHTPTHTYTHTHYFSLSFTHTNTHVHTHTY